jgi:hypothetical protein
MLAGFAWLRVAGCSRFGWVVWGGLRTTALATAALGIYVIDVVTLGAYA